MAIGQEIFNSEVDQVNPEKELPLLEILFSKKFISIYIMASCHFFYGYFYQVVFKLYGKDYINDDEFLTFVGATAAFSNGVFKIMWATLLDKYSFRRIYLGIISLHVLSILFVQVAVYNRLAFMLITCLTFVTDGSLASMLPAMTAMQFGDVRGPHVYSYMNSIFGVSAFLSMLIYTTNVYSISGMFIYSFLFSVTAAVLAYKLDE